ncbi:MAG: cobalamin B12-binding domain-containing protein [Promethearchaeota archaeon]|jgi:5-methyltetrahydrofolate--homocysteine methyltransferase
MKDNEILEKLMSAIINGNPEDAVGLVNKSLEAGIDPRRLLNDVIIRGAEEVGLKYEREEFFLADMLLAADAINVCMDEIKLKLKDGAHLTLGKVLIGTPEGDLHSIGKSLVIALLQGQGFEVIDLGVDVPPEKFLEAAEKENVDIIGISGLLTMTISKMTETVVLLKRKGIKAKIVLGGGILSEESCRQIGADAWTKDGWEGVKLIKKLMGVS